MNLLEELIEIHMNKDKFTHCKLDNDDFNRIHKIQMEVPNSLLHDSKKTCNEVEDFHAETRAELQDFHMHCNEICRCTSV